MTYSSISQDNLPPNSSATTTTESDCAALLLAYEISTPPPNLESPLSSKVYLFRHRRFWRHAMFCTFVVSIVASGFELHNHKLASLASILLFALDLLLLTCHHHQKIKIHAVLLMLAVNCAEIFFLRYSPIIAYSSILKPIVWFHVFEPEFNTFRTFLSILPRIFKLLFFELVVILFCAVAATELFGSSDEQYRTMRNSFFNLFVLSTTVSNPSSWSEAYKKNKFVAFFFVGFLVLTVFFLHALVLAIVFDSYAKVTKRQLAKSLTNRGENLRMAWMAICEMPGDIFSNVKIENAKAAIKTLRSHYRQNKMEIIFESLGTKDYLTFEKWKIVVPQALAVRVRRRRRRRRQIWLMFNYPIGIFKTTCRVLPATHGPLLLLACCFHVYAYVGVILFGGGNFGGTTATYNFKSYCEGLVTLFNMAVVNDWNQLAQSIVDGGGGRSSLDIFHLLLRVGRMCRSQSLRSGFRYGVFKVVG